MNGYSQNDEDLFILDLYKKRKFKIVFEFGVGWKTLK